MSSCLTPIIFKSGIRAPCGHCSECLRRFANAWSFRLQKEMQKSDLTLFNTLTYDDCNLPILHARFSSNGVLLASQRRDKVYVGNPKNMEVFLVNRERYDYACTHSDSVTHLPIKLDEYENYFPIIHDTATLVKKDVVDYHKRLRKYLDSINVNMKYFIVGEYGSVTARPHYHEIIMLSGSACKDPHYDIDFYRNAILQTWNKGNIDCSVASDFGAVNYALKYMRKKPHFPTGSAPNFRLMSKGIGLRFLNDNISIFKQFNEDELRLYFPSGVATNLPRYYRNKLYESNTMIQRFKTDRRLDLVKQKDYIVWLQSQGLLPTTLNKIRYLTEYQRLKEDISILRNSSSNSCSTIKESKDL